MIRKLMYSFFIFAVLPIAPVFSDSNPFCVQPYISDPESASFAATLSESLAKESGWAVLPAKAEQPFLYPEGENAQTIIDGIAEKGDDADAERVILGRVTAYNGWLLVDTCVISVKDKKIIYTSSLSVKADDTESAPAKDILGRIKRFADGKSFPVSNLAASRGDHDSFTRLTWDPVAECTLYEILSSTESEEGPFIPAGTSQNPLYIDAHAKPGIKTWYEVCPIIEGVRAEPSVPASGYRKHPFPKDIDLKTLLHSFNKPRPKMSAAEAKKAEEDIAYLRKWYQNPTKLNLILFMSKEYLKKKELYTLRGSDNYQFSTDGREIRIVPADARHMIVFKNGTFFRRIASRGDKALTDRLMQNALLFCVPVGDVETTDEEGNRIFIPRFDVVTMCTTYYRDYAEWNSTTLLYTTVDESLKLRVDEEKKKVEEQNADQ